MEPHDDAGFGRLPGLQIDRLFWKCDVNPRLFHFRKRHYGALQFAFESAPVIDVLDELGSAEIGFVK